MERQREQSYQDTTCEDVCLSVLVSRLRVVIWACMWLTIPDLTAQCLLFVVLLVWLFWQVLSKWMVYGGEHIFTASRASRRSDTGTATSVWT